ncbi:MFS transporter [Psychromarinibacter sp. S121]|uniref:MFS transporter n=1 Tax=Psychromarinibacter sp. S121 TaxID=3415127 RepID=UPI003C7AEB67
MTDRPAKEPMYRWIIVIIASTMLAISMGQLVNGLSAFFLPLEAQFGWARGEIALINTAGLIGLGLGGIVMGFAADRLDIRKVALTGAIVTGGAILLASRANALWQLYALFFVAGALGGGALFAPLMALVGGWFRTRAGLAIGLVAAGQALGQGGMPVISAMLIEAMGWRGAMSALGIGTLATLVPLALLVRRPPVAPSAGTVAVEVTPPLRPATTVIVLGAAVLCCCSLMSVPLMHLIPLAQGCGIGATGAGSILFVMMIAAILGRVAFGQLADMIGALPAYLLASAWQTALVFVFTQLVTLEQMLTFAPIYGFGYAGVMTGVLTTIRSQTPAHCRASCTGIILAFAWFGHGIGGLVGGVFYDATGAYETTFGVAVLFGLVNLAIVGGLFWVTTSRRPGRLAGSAAA